MKKLNHKSLLAARCVSRIWNNEFLSHISQNLIIDDTKRGNLNFINKVKLPEGLIIDNLQLRNYKSIFGTPNKFKRVQLVSIRFPYISQPKLDIKQLSDNCMNLTVLKFHRPVLGTCNLETISHSIQPKSIFPNLAFLMIRHVDKYQYACDGKKVAQLSKNISFLLDSIASENIKALSIELNADYCDINASRGRKKHRFETKSLPKFICRQPNLKVLVLDIPIGLEEINFTNTFPTQLELISINNRIGTIGIYNGYGQIVINREELQWDGEEYDILDEFRVSLFWRSFLLAQTKLEHCDFLAHANYSEATLVSTIVENNANTLKRLSLDVMLTGEIDGTKIAAATNLEKFHVANCITHELIPQQIGDCKITGLVNLPSSVNELKFINVVLELDEIEVIGMNHNLKDFQLVYDWNHYINLESLEYFNYMLDLLLNHPKLDHLSLGLVDYDDQDNLPNADAVQQGVVMRELREWIDEDDHVLVVPNTWD